jgi:uncharacterized protein
MLQRGLGSRPVPLQWLVLVCLSVGISWAWGAVGLPAGLLIGPMAGGLIFGVNGLRLTLPSWSNFGAQAVIAAMIAAAITPAIITTFSHDALLFCCVMAATLLGAAALGWLISRLGLIPGATAIYGISPGAAGAMVLLGEAEGGDARLIAFMQYSRVLLVAAGAACVARFWVGVDGSHSTAGGPHWFAPVHWGSLTLVLLLALIGQQFASLARLPAWAIMGPMLLLSALHAGGWIEIDLPRWLLAIAYALLGWRIGLDFRRDALLHASKMLPAIVGAALGLMAICAVLAWGLTSLAHVDALTAYLATSPGGLDSVAIIASSASRVDLPFVLALQSVRLFSVIGLAPFVTRFVVKHSPHLAATAE